MIALRAATPGDATAIRAMVRAAYARWVPAMGREPIPMQTDYAKAIARHRIDLHHVDGALVALIETHATPDHLLVVNVAVAPDFQGRGLGRALLAHAEAVATSLGLLEIRLFTNKVMDDNIALYRRVGYRLDREEPFMDGAVVHMSKRLAPSTL